jgi:hypothetical protein
MDSPMDRALLLERVGEIPLSVLLMVWNASAHSIDEDLVQVLELLKSIYPDSFDRRPMYYPPIVEPMDRPVIGAGDIPLSVSLSFWEFWALVFFIASFISLCLHIILKLMEYIFKWDVFAAIARVEYIFWQEAYYFLALVEDFILQEEGSIVPAFILVIVCCLEV